MSKYPHIAEANAGAILTVDLDAVIANYRKLIDRVAGASVAAVVKANAYGLGVDRVAPALAGAGCRVFFVAHIEEGIYLRQVLNETGVSDFVHSEIHILGGLLNGTEEACDASRLIPVLGSIDEIHNWKNFCRKIESALPCDIHIDTGMLRLGLPPVEVDKLVQEPARLDGLNIVNVMSHLACADESEHPKNAEQLKAFNQARSLFPQGQASFANSAGIFLGADYHFDLVRPGLSIYGGAAVRDWPNPMAQVIRLQGKIVQLRDVDTPQTVGYGASHQVKGPGRIATVPVGYADGYLRYLGNRGTGHIGNIPVPVVGRTSMDLITLDVSDVPKHLCSVGDLVDLIGPLNSIEQVAEAANTINYEILTSLGHRYHRVYVGGESYKEKAL